MGASEKLVDSDDRISAVKEAPAGPDEMRVIWKHGYWVEGPADASHELMEYELGRRAKNDLLHNDLVLFGLFV